MHILVSQFSAPADLSPAAKKFLKLMDITTTGEPTEDDRLGQKVVEWYGRKSMYLFEPRPYFKSFGIALRC